jgi:hypothetical protein
MDLTFHASVPPQFQRQQPLSNAATAVLRMADRLIKPPPSRLSGK